MENREIKTVGDLLASTAAARPDKVWLREKAGKDSIAEKTFSEMYEDARKVSSFLAKQGEPAVHAGILSSSGIACITAMLGTMISGNVAVVIDPQLSLDEMTDNLNRADVTVLFYDRRFLSKLDEIKAACP